MAKNEKIGHFAIRIFRIPAVKNYNVTPLRVSIRSQESISDVIFAVGRTCCNIRGFWPNPKITKNAIFTGFYIQIVMSKMPILTVSINFWGQNENRFFEKKSLGRTCRKIGADLFPRAPSSGARGKRPINS